MPAAPMLFYASQAGASTFDADAGGGNPFASALIDLLARPTLALTELRAELVALTMRKSDGLQVPDTSHALGDTAWQLRPVPPDPARRALVFVYADYRHPGMPPLPGARRDLERVGDALWNAGFAVTSLVDPTATSLRAALHDLATDSRDAEAAVVYATGHGFEHRGDVYLIPNDVPASDDTARMVEASIRVADLADHLQASAANLVFFGGCRSEW